MRTEPYGDLSGRRCETAAIRAAVAATVDGRGSTVIVQGEPGIGKSSLVAVCLTEALSLGCQVFHASADPLTTQFSLHVLRTALELPSAVETARTGTPFATDDPTAALAEEITAHVDRLCAKAPTVVAIDDLHWADDDSLQVWSRLAAASAQMALLLVATARPVPRQAEIGRLRGTVAAQQGLVIDLEPLPELDSADLAGRLAGAPLGPGLRAAVAAGGGNPLYVREIIEAQLRAGAIELTAGYAETRGLQPVRQVSLTGAIADRLNFLSEPTRDILRHASLLGADFWVTDLAVLTGRTASHLVTPLDESLTAGVLAADGSRLRFRHGLIRDCLYESMPPSLRAALHRQAANALAAAGALPERVAAQLLQVSDEPDGWTKAWLLDHGSSLATRAPEAAQELLTRALAHGLPTQSGHEELEQFLVTAALHTGDHQLLERVSRRILSRTTDPERTGAVTWLLGYDLLRTERADDVLTLLETLPLTEQLSPHVVRLRTLRACALFDKARFEEGRAEASEALRIARQEPDPSAIAYPLHALSSHAWQTKDLPRAVALIDEALEALDGDPSATNPRILLLSNRLNMSPTAAEAATALDQARNLARLAGGIHEAHLVGVESAFYYRTGRWDDAMAALETDVAVFGSTSSREIRRHGLAALITARRDMLPTAREHLAAVEGLEIAAPIRAHSHWFIVARAAVAEREGNPEAALALLAPTVSNGETALQTVRWRWLPTMIRLACSTDDQTLAAKVVAVALTDASEPATERHQVSARWCQALLTGDVATLDDCAAYFRRAGWPLQVAEICEEAAVISAASQDLAGARARLDEAVAIYSELGASWELSRAEARLKAQGVRRRRGGCSNRAASGWESLTRTELKVAALVAEGLSNPDIATALFISRRTVQVHVSHILAKLELRSRVEVAVEASRHL